MICRTWYSVDGAERPEHPDRPDGGEVELLHVQAVLEGAGGQGSATSRGHSMEAKLGVGGRWCVWYIHHP